MMRLANYFLVVAYDHEASKSGFGEGKVIQKFPVNDWKDCPFDQSIQEFCQPGGWLLSASPRSPNFMVCALTNSTGGRLFCACLTFDEPCHTSHAPDDEGLLFAPKSLVLLASHNYCGLLKNCLSLIYTIFSDNLQWELEKVVANILAGIPIPSPGGPKVTFSLLGAEDTQAVQPPQCGKIPITGNTVHLLFQLLGIQNVLMLFSAMLTDQKILITSRSFVRLFDVCHALSSLLYPLRYVCVYIPVLPRKLLDYLSTPTPCLVGIHVSFLEAVSETYEFCIADIDKGSVEPPRNLVNLAPSELIMVSEPFYSAMLSNLTQILNPDLLTADLVFAPASTKHRHLNKEEWTDKRLRAVFLQFFLHLFVGYRSCLSITRIHPQPVIHFNQSLFLLLRGLSDSDEFLNRFFLGMTFPQFIQERGSPYREVDLFDRVVADEEICRDRTITSVDYLAERLMENERNLYPPAEQKLPQPRSNKPQPKPFPILEESKMQRRLKRNAERFPSICRRMVGNFDCCDEDEWIAKPESVPMGLVLDLDQCLLVTTHDQMAKLHVLRGCIDSIFDGRISDAKKVLRAVKRDLKSRVMRHHLMKYMEEVVQRPPASQPSSPAVEAWTSTKTTLSRAQFELVVELLDEALRQDAGGGQSGTLHHGPGLGFSAGGLGGYFGSGMGEGAGSEAERSCDCSGIAASVLHQATNLHMQVHNVKYFSYMCEELQKHAVWESCKFWKSFFHLEVAKQIHELYLTRYPNGAAEGQSKMGIVEAMEMAAEELRRWPDLEESERVSWVAQEERSVLFQIQHCLSQILHFRLPVNVSERRYQQQLESMGAENASSIMTNSEDGTDSVDQESGFDEHAQATLLTSLDNFMRRFVRLVATENDLPQSMIDNIEDKIEGLREGDIATLDEVRREVKRPRATRSEVSPPELVGSEALLLEVPLRAFLLPDSRTDPCEQLREVDPLLSPSTPPLGQHHHLRQAAQAASCEGLLPAEGALFLTNYRVVFRGVPVDCLLTDRQVVRSFPVSSLMSVKKHGAQRVASLLSVSKEDAYDVMVLRAANFQLLKLAFEEEVSREDREMFRSLLLLCRYPLRLEASFLSPASLHEQEEEKAGDRAGKSKSTLTRARMFCKQTMEKARLKVSKRPAFHSPIFYRAERQTPSMPRPFIGNEAKQMEFLQARPAYRDLSRQNLGQFQGTFSMRQSKSEGFKLSMVNSKYQVCPSYPAMLVVPAEVNERSLNKIVRGHKENRIPVVTYRHAPTRALLIRAGGFRQHQSGGWRSGASHMSPISERDTLGDTTDCTPSSVSGSEFLHEQEKYLTALVAHSPDPDTMSVAQEPLFPLETPLPGRRDFRDSSRSKNATAGDRRWSQFYGPNGPPTSGLLSGSGYRRVFDAELSSCTDQEAVSEWSAVSSSVTRLSLGPLVVLGEKSQMKLFSKARRPSVSFLPVVPPHTRKSLKESFKKLYRVCLTSDQPTLPAARNDIFRAALHDVEWLRQVKGTLQLAGAVVDIMDTHGSSVLVALEEGWDLTAQVVALAELMLDPHYRSLPGFVQLVDKEWQAFGHRFTQRSSQTEATKPSGFSPVFLLFLDCVHQVLRQFPTQFEFNEYFLQFLAHHHLSGRFSTFKFDCEEERMMVTFAEPESSIWRFVHTQHRQSPIFFNFLYVPPTTSADAVDHVLRPAANTAALDVWSFYLTEEMSAVFDVDLLLRSLRPQPQQANASGEQTEESGPTSFLQFNYNTGCCTVLFSSLFSLLLELGPRWHDEWEQTQSEVAGRLVCLDESPHTSWLRDQSRHVAARQHKKATRELLYRGRQTGEEEGTGEEETMFKQAHQFTVAPFNTSRRKCDLCSHWLLITAKAVVCAQCKYFCHEKCAVNVPKNCVKPQPAAVPETKPNIPSSRSSGRLQAPPPRPPPPPPPVPPHAAQPEPQSDRRGSVASVSDTVESSSVSAVRVDKRSATLGNTSSASSVASSRTAVRASVVGGKTTLSGPAAGNPNNIAYCGYLYKQGHRLRFWKRRFYILDSVRHQLQYYETDDPSTYRGYIALNDVRSVKSVRTAPMALKKTPENAFIEVECPPRTHRFAADDARAAREWCDRLQTYIS